MMYQVVPLLHHDIFQTKVFIRNPLRYHLTFEPFFQRGGSGPVCRSRARELQNKNYGNQSTGQTISETYSKMKTNR